MSQRADREGSTRAILLGLMVAAGVAAWALPPLPQDPAYHAFADGRALGPIANAANVLSNLVFLVAGLLGLRSAVRQIELPARPAWIVAFAGIALVSVGSAWYHRAPGDDTLLWDRLPMTIGFMGLLAAVLAIPFGERVARLALWPAVIVGVGSVVAWRLTGDLRLYVWVQFTPLLAHRRDPRALPAAAAASGARCSPRSCCMRSRKAASWRTRECSWRPPASSAATR